MYELPSAPVAPSLPCFALDIVHVLGTITPFTSTLMIAVAVENELSRDNSRTVSPLMEMSQPSVAPLDKTGVTSSTP